MAELVVKDLVRQYGPIRAVDGVSFTVKDGEFLTLLGPSGCGKSTTLSALAGLERPDSGSISLGDRTFFDSEMGIYLAPEQRDIGLVFQSYALWPHMTVRANLDFPLQLRKLSKAERQRRIEEALDLVEMAQFADRFPHALSGGQQQRVALARTLVYRPSLLLLDEPLSNLDAKLRERAQVWLRKLQSRIGLTTVYVTHDQSEALALSDRVAVLNQGRIVQLDKPGVIYEFPADAFVADFIGSSNFFRGKIAENRDGRVHIAFGQGKALVSTTPGSGITGGNVTVAIRPERIELLPGNSPKRAGQENIFSVHIEEISYLGARNMITARLDDVVFRLESDTAPVDSAAWVHIPKDACRVFAA